MILPGDLTEHPTGATPLSEGDLKGLLPTWVTTRAELNTVEAENILRARLWATSSRRFRNTQSLLHLDRLPICTGECLEMCGAGPGTCGAGGTLKGSPAPIM